MNKILKKYFSLTLDREIRNLISIELNLYQKRDIV